MCRLLSGLLLVCAAAGAQTLQTAVDSAAAATVAKFRAVGLKAPALAITVIDLHDRQHAIWASNNGSEMFYPASVVKLFYLVAAHAWMESGKLTASTELDRALHDMIVSSSNDATQLVFSMLTQTTGGWELAPAELQPWLAKREAVNQYFEALGYKGINVNQPTFAEDPYGRERQARGTHFENNNRLSTDAVARLWLSIVRREAVSPARSNAMLRLLRRDPFLKDNPDEQATSFGGKALPSGSEYYSKAGWTSVARNDSAFVRLPNGAEYIFVVFTRDNANNEDIVPFVSGQIAAYFLSAPSTVH